MPVDGPISEKISNIEAFGQTLNLLMNLSRYLDIAANSVMAGTLNEKDRERFSKRAGQIYSELRTDILEMIQDDAYLKEGERMLRALEEESDLLEMALVVDQAHGWLETSIRHGAFGHRMKLLNIQLGLEEAAANAQLGEQREKAQVFEDRLSGKGKGSIGNYV
jgi:hypothetical protein